MDKHLQPLMSYYHCTKCAGKDCKIGVDNSNHLSLVLCPFFPAPSIVGMPLADHKVRIAKWERIE